MATPRTGRALIDATRPYAKDDAARSWMETGLTLGLCTALETLILFEPHPVLRAVAIVLLGLMLVRAFILFHDYMHRAILRRSKLAKLVYPLVGWLLLTPASVWRRTHNYHHANNSKIVGSHIGSYPIMTTTMWRRARPMDRLRYRLVRHPLTQLFGYVTVFALGMCLLPLVRRPKDHRDALAALLVHGAWLGLVGFFFGGMAMLEAVVLPMMIATATGSYLFYAQHNFPDMNVQSREKWDYVRAALECSSFMDLPGWLHWLTGNIGYHHVHHLNPTIPFYRLPEAMDGIEELQEPGRTSLAPKDVWACLRLDLWDPRKKRMVSRGD
ncbi:MAG TPA: fatty acid desaturase [Polyangiaceae bacterium LLY-WYZ-15_(1-7)]|nr:fatty acid desaturase [Polyangiaceae bacterium LLY-WYZ-15_(1-7)]HJL05785.1 fatty acid desaturase [Polyangiaceae bacterium LLY-WYZ-15_(1-7)]HJL09911.1 fatty acid desaturase [Polyangiaceae bacterium LLY-WYZ-15_(1-7)]HJL25294.1 fatty acid desaturase [Polyangiaceae bacterium LLY-WYZ-15_(1-7)]HJL32202.1 fatty acid desaturase [Polyangiaceae bacterium LLY-WYZ-15_(1-7)]